jgi:hypothetical protein
MLKRVKIALLAAIVTGTATAALARPVQSPDSPGAVVYDEGQGGYRWDARSPASRDIDPTGGTFQGGP